MKTKIIYISGSEVFEMSQVRAAFEEIRQTLGLSKDTILFGVPVDADNAFENEKQTEHNVESNLDNMPVIDENINIEPEPIVTSTKTRKNKKVTKKVEPIIEEIITTNVNDEQIIKEVNNIDENITLNTDDDDTVIPILSILATNDSEPENITEPENTENIIDSFDIPEQPVEVEIQQTIVNTPDDEEVIISDIRIDSEIITPNPELDEGFERKTIADMINDDAPISDTEQTIEQLLESMTPLREDFESDEQNNQDSTNFDFDIAEEVIDDDDDATLAQLASEFAKTEDKIIVENKPETHGKIGKLKNILPFKKVKQQDNSLMGDLFGWAGIAANDEEFSMPGFFTPNTSRKQGS